MFKKLQKCDEFNPRPETMIAKYRTVWSSTVRVGKIFKVANAVIQTTRLGCATTHAKCPFLLISFSTVIGR